MKTVAIIGTFDTKGEEFAYVKTRFEELGINTITIHWRRIRSANHA